MTDETIFTSRAQKRRMGDGPFDTAAVAAGENLAAHPRAATFNEALTAWRRQPTANCLCCESRFTEAPVKGFLLVAAHKRNVALAAAFCVRCFRADNPDLEAVTERLLRAFIPSGRFLDEPQNETAASGYDAAAKRQLANNNASAGTDANTRQSERGAAHVS